MARKYEHRAFLKPSVLRPVVTGLFAAVVAVGLVIGGDWGTYSSFGPSTIAAICPLGAFEALFGAWAFVPRLVIAVACVCLIVLVAGRAFCGWICPVPPIARFFTTRKRRAETQHERHEAGCEALARWKAREDGQDVEPTKARLDSRHVVLLGALGSAAVFGFPVFCLVCPIGLTIGTAVLMIRLVGFNEPSIGLVVFPLIVVAELVLARDFCGKLCPMAALMSLITRANRTFRPHADVEKCLRTTAGEDCHACSSACPGHIDPQSNLGLAPVSECTRCARCAEACPAGALSFPVLPPKEPEPAAPPPSEGDD